MSLAKRALAEAYARTVRPFFPLRPAIYGGVPVAVYRHAGDSAVARHLGPFAEVQDNPRYEETLLTALRAHVRPGDTVTIVGGGAGVTAVVAARLVGPDGAVSCFEGGERQVEIIRQTLLLNGVADRVNLRHAIIGPAIGIYGAPGEAEPIAAAQMPSCDVLELDCEGSEVDILQNLAFVPRTILVETHGMYGAPSALCAQLLAARGYRVTVLGLAEPEVADFCEGNDIRILVGETVPSPVVSGTA
ncbi:hypothetical protein [Ancylobacter aquaticus]|uniref:hypothetical protein n=1 Tax=Ancylobacter aquaticus TaxID=100 RepID=UPI00104F0DD7|nr:hypothetical protein [Ancylobacter aquaticus]